MEKTYTDRIMMNRITVACVVLAGCVTMFSGCRKDKIEPPVPLDPDNIAVREDRTPFHKSDLMTGKTPSAKVSSDKLKLHFFGWGEEQDFSFNLTFPKDKEYERVIIAYTMTSFFEGPASYDNTTMLFVRNKTDGQWYELTRAFTPYGNAFNSSWSKTFWIDVSEYSSMLSGDTEFRLYYGGFDATPTRSHAVRLDFNLYEGKPSKKVVWTSKVYDSSRDGNSGYRGWSYGVKGHDIEDASRLGKREFTLPQEVKSLLMKVAVSGHGHDQGRFIERTGYVTRNAAEFDENTYSIVINGVTQKKTGRIFYSNKDNYPQAGTYLYDRANWAPGNPLNVHYWTITPPESSRRLSLDLNLEKFESQFTDPKAEGCAQYIVEVDLFGLSD